MTLDDILDGIARREDSSVQARVVNVRADKGGPTFRGITLAAFQEWRKPVLVTVEDLAKITESEIRDIYRSVYIVRPGFSVIQNTSVLALVADCSVNHGRVNAAKLIQKASHVFPDGIFGEKSQSAANRMEPKALYRNLCAQRVSFQGQIITAHPTQAIFAAGWANRSAEFIREVA